MRLVGNRGRSPLVPAGTAPALFCAGNTVSFSYAQLVALVGVVGISGMSLLGDGISRAIGGDGGSHSAASARGAPRDSVAAPHGPLGAQAGVIGALSRRARGIARAEDLATPARAAQATDALPDRRQYLGTLISALRTAPGEGEALRLAAARSLMEPFIDRDFVLREAGYLPMGEGDLARHADVRRWRGDWLASDLVFQASGVQLDAAHAAETWSRLLARRRGRLKRGRSFEEDLARVSEPTLGVANDARLRDDARALAYDYRTGFLRQDSISAVFPTTIDTARELGAPVAVTFLDFDRFKQINDTYGHGAGDAVISKVAKVIHSTVRDSDLVFRYGGDEFMVVSPGVSAEHARALAERIGSAVSREVNAPWLADVLRADGLDALAAKVPADWRQTISLGVVHAAVPGAPDTLLKQSDFVMFEAKGAGRNTVHVRELP